MNAKIGLHKFRLWPRWVAANALGELFGLGLTLAVIAMVSLRLDAQVGVGVILLSFLIAIASGAIEATLVGLSQWWAMHPWFPTIARLEWWLATLVGALVAYALGYLPSTLMSSSEPQPQGAIAEPPQWVVLLLAAALGAVAGIVLAFAQWFVLRRHVDRAGRWLLANMLAWLVGMPIIFAGIDAAFAQPSTLRAVAVLAVILLLAGTIVGAIHGAFLVQLAASSDHLDQDGAR